MSNETHPDSALIDALGGPVRVGELCKVTPQAVSMWRRAGIPQARRMFLEVVRPEAFARDAEPQRAKAAA